ncbi:uncharacterized protein I303_107743 [Kwoniella dejecticola CBS 10117]|uniref:Uncharacterized protein n=1 Tax=Kwoniella dejecticola CBS 10117 TaxID=1296121 RepID=A0AAJ8KVH2_9TREE
MATLSPVNFCFSAIATTRCQALSNLQHIVVFMPGGIQILLLPIIVIGIIRIPRTLILLAIEISTFVAISAWDLSIRLSPPGLEGFKLEDMVLAIISPIPNLFFHLSLTSYLMNSQSTLPAQFRSRLATILFGLFAIPLIPFSAIASIIPSSLSTLEYARLRDDRISIRFPSPSDADTFQLWSFIGVATTIAYTTIVAIITLAHATFSPSLVPALNGTKRRRGKFHITVASGMVLAIAEMGMSVAIAKQTLAMLVARRIIRLISRTCLILGFFYLYQPEARGKDISTAREEDQKGMGRGRDTIATFGTPPSAFLNRGGTIVQRQTTSATHKSSRSGKKNKKPSKLVIGNPITSTFTKYTTEQSRQFDLMHSTNFGVGLIGSQMVNLSSPFLSNGFGKKEEKVVVRTPKKRPPILSFAGSTFTQSSLNALVSTIPLRHVNSRQGQEIGHETGHGYGYGTPLSRSTTSVKKNVGSIYRPDRISVDMSDLSMWPPQTFNTNTSNGAYYDGQQNQNYGQTRQFAIGEIVGPNLTTTATASNPFFKNAVPRSNSIKRKAVPPLQIERQEGSSPMQSIVRQANRVSTYFTSLRSPQTHVQGQVSAAQQSLVGGVRAQPNIEDVGLDEKGKTRERSGTDTERGIWFSNPPPTEAKLSPDANSKEVTRKSILRPTLPYRRSTNPADAIIYPSPTASSTLEGTDTDGLSRMTPSPRYNGALPSLSSGLIDTTAKSNTNARLTSQRTSLNRRSSIGSIYSDTNTNIDTGTDLPQPPLASLASGRLSDITKNHSPSQSVETIGTTKNLFYNTPIQSPSSSPTKSFKSLTPPEVTRTSSASFYTDTDLRSRPQPQSTQQASTRPIRISRNQSENGNESTTITQKRANEASEVIYMQPHNEADRYRQSELQTVLARLTKLRRETGFSGTFEFESAGPQDDDIDEEDDSFIFDLNENENNNGRKPWMRSRIGEGRDMIRSSYGTLGTMETFSEGGLTIESEDLTPVAVAEVRLINANRRNYGGVV